MAIGDEIEKSRKSGPGPELWALEKWYFKNSVFFEINFLCDENLKLKISSRQFCRQLHGLSGCQKVFFKILSFWVVQGPNKIHENSRFLMGAPGPPCNV